MGTTNKKLKSFILSIILPNLSWCANAIKKTSTIRRAMYAAPGDVVRRDKMASVISDNTSCCQDNETMSPVLFQRGLNDFEEFNNLLDGIELSLPDIYVAGEKILGSTVHVWGTEIRCRSLKVDDINFSPEKFNNTRFDLTVHVKRLDASCSFTWRYSWR